MPDVGDQITATLLVEPFDASTRAGLTATKPDGSVVVPVVSTADGGQTWTAPVDLDLAGTWVLKWTVTGTGGSVEFEEIGVGPGLSYSDPDVRIYADTTDLANFLRSAPPIGAAKMLEDASRKMDGVLLTAVYATDALGMPTDARKRKAIADATCAIVEWWIESGGDALGVEGDWTSASAGGVSVSRDASKTVQVSGQQIPWKAWNVLNREGLLPGVVYQR
jgi:hypothetical protein